MCIAYPGLVVSVDAAGATVSLQGRERRASTLLHPDLRSGEWVLVAVGTVVQRLSDEEASALRKALDAAGAGAA